MALDATAHRAVAVALLSTATSSGPTLVDTVDAGTGRPVREEQPESGIHGAVALSVDGARHKAYLATVRYGGDAGVGDGGFAGGTPPTSLYVVDTRTGHVIPGPALPGNSSSPPAGSLAEALDTGDERLAVIVPGDGQVHMLDSARL